MINFIGITSENNLETENSIGNIDFSIYKWFWVDFNQPTEEEIKHLDHTFNFHPLAIEDCIHRLQRPKLDYFNDHNFFVTHIVREEGKEIIKEELNFFVGEKYIVTFHLTPSIEVDEVWKRVLQKNIEKWDPFYVFYRTLDKIVDNYFPIIYKIEEDLDIIEGNINHKSMNLLLAELFDTRHKLLNLMHTVNPMRDLLYRMLNSHHLDRVNQRREYFSDIYDHLLKLSDTIMTDRELTADIRDSYLSLNSHQTNNVMKVLTIITSIFAPLTFIAGIYGMNFENMPELTWSYGYFLTLGIMGILGVSMFIWFKRKGWFK
ncbi:magnesium transporter [Solibacillus kalamii]|uniref:Magnesium transport protein CorA n=1 Tax=Solibacillus kalamii TaxID=1748298 RepID=A0ABX3ZGI0_9BACL|nr:magnesium/cobalt transporter CorA [Solibacillus kalamii]MBM7665927.1 magnesium transporter [Solibacillus kalamii]OUZ38641.1 magnesium and cobalt transport protein CorA [Solibacillus kalamii]